MKEEKGEEKEAMIMKGEGKEGERVMKGGR